MSETKTRRKKQQKRIFVIDTNVVIHDPTAIFQFAEHDVVIPFTVLEEVDKLKNGQDTRNLSAREFIRNLEKATNNSDGNPLGKDHGNLTFATWDKYPEEFKFSEDTSDHRILTIAYNLKEKYKDSEQTVTLVTKDINLRHKAKAIGVHAEDYTHDMVKSIDLENEILHKTYSEVMKLKPGNKLVYLNSPIIIHDSNKKEDMIGRWDGNQCNLISRNHIGKTGIKAKNLEQDFAVDILMDESITAIALIGSAGSGKTLLTVASAIAQKGKYRQILVARPAIELSNRTMGFLPGSLEGKYKPYLTPIGSACRIIIENNKSKAKKADFEDVVIEKWMKENGIELLPLSMIRGNTFPNSFIIIDVSQNLTPKEVKTIVSRAGEGTKIVFTGDINQIDVEYLSRESNGLSHLIARFKGERYFAHIEMQKSVRSALAEAADKLL